MSFVEKKFDIFTGFAGEQDEQLQREGNVFIVFEYMYEAQMPPEFKHDSLLAVTSDLEKADEMLQLSDWTGWVAIKAKDEESARQKYYDAHDQWEAKGNGWQDWKEIVNEPVESRF